MSEELNQKGLSESGLRIGKYEFYSIGGVTLKQLKEHKIIPQRDYGVYSNRKPDALLVDRRNKSKVKVIAVVEYKDSGKFQSEADKLSSVRQCNDVGQVLGAEIAIATDNSAFIWFNPRQPNLDNEYVDPQGLKRSFSYIKDDADNEFLREFVIDQRNDEENIENLSDKTKASILSIELLRKHISENCSKISPVVTIDPAGLAKQIWQDVWSVSGATPERCLYTFLELFIFKYLSDLHILEEDDIGNKVSFAHIFTLSPDKAFKNYTEIVRPYLKSMFPASTEDFTTIINGTVLNASVPEHSQVFHKILKKFSDFGELKHIDPNFKSKVFESFMKESISKKNWGQFFTPRNIIDAIIEISDIDQLESGSEICDPACGVGGFLLEPLKVKTNGLNTYYHIKNNQLKPKYVLSGFDKGFEKEEQLTIILAKANMLIFLSELLVENPTLSHEFAKVFNSTFKLLNTTILGTLQKTEKDKYDLILTNPPYVTSGSSNYKEAIKNDSKFSNFYKVNAIGVEGLFMEWIIRSLKPARKAFVVIPDGILHRLNDKKLRQFIKDECRIDAIISLPINAFYTTPKKTYILAITKKDAESETDRKSIKQVEPVFTYLVSNIGETLDVNRFPIKENDLIEAVNLFNQFKGSKNSFITTSLRCKIQSIDEFNPEESWTIDRWWTEEEKIELGIEEERLVLSVPQLIEEMEETKVRMNELIESLHEFED